MVVTAKEDRAAVSLPRARAPDGAVGGGFAAGDKCPRGCHGPHTWRLVCAHPCFALVRRHGVHSRAMPACASSLLLPPQLFSREHVHVPGVFGIHAAACGDAPGDVGWPPAPRTT